MLQKPLILLVTITICVWTSACDKTRKVPNFKGFKISKELEDVDRVWAKRIPGLISDMSVSPSGKQILIGTVRDRAKSSGSTAIYQVGADGKTRWSKKLKSKIKAQAISNDGSMSLVTTYNSKLTAYNVKGRELWNVDNLCQPRILSQSKKVICYFNDDSHPDLAFELYSWAGKKEFSYHIPQEILDLEVSVDEKFVALGLVGGMVSLLQANFTGGTAASYVKKFDVRVPGEIVDIEIQDGQDPSIFVLFHYRKIGKSGQHLAVLNQKGQMKSHIKLTDFAQTIRPVKQGGDLLLYGNSPRGQYIAYLNLPIVGESTITWDQSAELEKIKWKYGDKNFADYSSDIKVTKSQAIVGFEDVLNKERVRKSYLLSFDYEGMVHWGLPLTTESGAYLYQKGFGAMNEKRIYVATDNSLLSAYKIK